MKRHGQTWLPIASSVQQRVEKQVGRAGIPRDAWLDGDGRDPGKAAMAWRHWVLTVLDRASHSTSNRPSHPNISPHAAPFSLRMLPDEGGVHFFPLEDSIGRRLGRHLVDVRLPCLLRTAPEQTMSTSRAELIIAGC